MRDIRGELQERASLFEEQINAHEAEFEKHIEQLKRERDSRLEDLNAELEAVTRLMEIEVRRLSSAPPARTREPVHPAVHQPAQQSAHQSPQHSAHQSPQHPVHQPPQHSAHQPPQHSAHQPVQHSSRRPQPQPIKQAEQPLADFLVRKLNEVGAMSLDDLRRVALQEGYFADAGLDVHNALFNVVKAGLIRQLPGGDFAPATIRLRRAM
jgi:hypothetical protein